MCKVVLAFWKYLSYLNLYCLCIFNLRQFCFLMVHQEAISLQDENQALSTKTKNKAQIFLNKHKIRQFTINKAICYNAERGKISLKKI